MAALLAARFSIAPLVREILGAVENAGDGVGYFVGAGGVRVRHTGCLVDQPKIAALIQEVKERLCQSRPQDVVEAALGRTWIILKPSPHVFEGTQFDALAGWTGGRIDRGVIEINVSPSGWEAVLREHLISLVEEEVSAR